MVGKRHQTKEILTKKKKRRKKVKNGKWKKEETWN